MFRILRRDTRGTTIAEYAIMLFLIVVIAALGFRVLGHALERKVGQANKHMSHQEGESASAGDNAPASTASAAAGAAGASGAAKSNGSSDISKDPTATAVASGGATGGESDQGSLPMIVRFALLALGVIGAAAAFFAMSKGKPTA